MVMAQPSLASVQKELEALREDVAQLKEIVHENYELSERAQKALKKARQTPESAYTRL